jgi:hypothetical protein
MNPLPLLKLPEWYCELCHAPVDLDEVVIEEEYGYEGEAWGYFTPAQKHTIVLSPCCRDGIVNNFGTFLEPYDVLD